MKKFVGKTLAMALMMGMFAGQAYAADISRVILAGTVDKEEEAATSGVHVNVYKDYTLDEHSSLYEDSLYFFDKDGKKLAVYGNSSIKLGNIILDTTTGLNMSGLDISGVKNLTVTGTLNASASGAIASDDTGLVTGGVVYTALQGKADAATTLAGYGITDAYTKDQTNSAISTAVAGKANVGDSYTRAESDAKYLTTHQDISGKAEKSYVDTELDKKADQTALDTETKERKDADADLQKQIDAIGGGSSAGLNELNNKINQTDARLNRVGATAAALAAINYQPMAKGQSQVAIGMGGYKGKKATAIGMAYQFSDRVSGSVAGAANGSEHMFNVGFNYLFGQHSAKDVAQMAATPGSMSLKEAELQATVDSQNAKISNLENANAAMQARMAQLEAMVKALATK